MAPNRKRKEKGDKGASSSSPTFDEARFGNVAAAQIYELLLTRSMPRERGFELEHARRPLIVQFIGRHWGNFIRPPTEAVIPVVREFYANLRANPRATEVRVRGIRVSFTASRINTLYNMPNIENDGYSVFKQEQVDFDEIINYLCYPGAVWKLNAFGQVMNFQARYLKQAASAVFLFVNARFMPAKHATDVTKEKSILIYCILKGYSVDVGKLIMTSILHSGRSNRNISLPHSSLITELCQSAGVGWDKSEEVLKLQVPINVPTRQTMDADDEPTARASGSTSQQAAEPSKTRRQRSMNERMDALEHKVDNISLNSSTFMSYVVEFNTVLAHRITNPNQPHPQFPQPPVWNDENQNDEENDDEENEENEEEEDDDDEH